MEQYSGPITTATSQGEGRLKVGVGNLKKKMLLKKILKYKDGSGGPGIAGYGKNSFKIPSFGSSYKPSSGKKYSGTLKIKKLKSLSSAVKLSSKKMKFAKAIKSAKSKIKPSFKNFN